MKNKEIRELSVKELKERLIEEQEHLTKLRFNNTVSQIENPHQIKSTKKLIARLLTEMRKRELENIQ